MHIPEKLLDHIADNHGQFELSHTSRVHDHSSDPWLASYSYKPEAFRSHHSEPETVKAFGGSPHEALDKMVVEMGL